MSYRLRSCFSVCIFAALVSEQVLAQSNKGFLAKQTNPLNITHGMAAAFQDQPNQMMVM